MQGPASQPALVFITIFWSQCLHSLPMSTLSLRPVRHQISGFDLRNFFIFWSLCVHLSLSWSSLSLSLAWTATWSFCPAVLLSSHQLALASCCFWNQTQALHPRVQSFVIVWSPISPHPKPINSTLVPGTIRHHFLLPKMTFNVPYHLARDFPGGTRGKEPACQCRRHRRRSFNPWFRKIPWKRAWKPTQVFLLGKSHGQRSLVGYSPWGHKRVRHNWARMWACTHTHTCMQGQAEGIEIVCKGMLRNEAEWSWESSGWTREYPGRDENNVVILPKGKFSDHMLFQAQRNSRKCGELESVGLGSCFSLNTTGYAMLDKWFPGRWRGWTMKLKAHFSSQKTGSLLSVAGAQHYITS